MKLFKDKIEKNLKFPFEPCREPHGGGTHVDFVIFLVTVKAAALEQPHRTWSVTRTGSGTRSSSSLWLWKERWKGAEVMQ
jgi:hypothetical protein